MRKDGYYWIKIKGFGWSDMGYNEWIIGFYSSYTATWSTPHSNVNYANNDPEEINENRISNKITEIQS